MTDLRTVVRTQTVCVQTEHQSKPHLWLRNAERLKQLRVLERQLNHLLDLLDMLVQCPPLPPTQHLPRNKPTLTFGCAMPSASNSSGCLSGSSITSLISLTCWS